MSSSCRGKTCSNLFWYSELSGHKPRSAHPSLLWIFTFTPLFQSPIPHEFCREAASHFALKLLCWNQNLHSTNVGFPLCLLIRQPSSQVESVLLLIGLGWSLCSAAAAGGGSCCKSLINWCIRPDPLRNAMQFNTFFLTGALCLSAGRGVLRLTRLPRHDRGPVPGGNRSGLAVYARSWDGHYTTTPTRSPMPCSSTHSSPAQISSSSSSSFFTSSSVSYSSIVKFLCTQWQLKVAFYSPCASDWCAVSWHPQHAVFQNFIAFCNYVVNRRN